MARAGRWPVPPCVDPQPPARRAGRWLATSYPRCLSRLSRRTCREPTSTRGRCRRRTPPSSSAELEWMRECLAPHTLRDHGPQRKEPMPGALRNPVPVSRMNVAVADPDRFGIEHLILAIVDFLVVLVQGAEKLVEGEEVRVTLRLRSATDAALTGELLGAFVGEVVAEDARRDSAQVCLFRASTRAPHLRSVCQRPTIESFAGACADAPTEVATQTPQPTAKRPVANATSHERFLIRLRSS